MSWMRENNSAWCLPSPKAQGQLFPTAARFALKPEVFTTLMLWCVIIHRAQHKPGEAWESR